MWNDSYHVLVGSKEAIEQLQQRIRRQYEDLTDIAYRLHAVFIHQGKKSQVRWWHEDTKSKCLAGQANYGHYWVYIYNHQKEQWWKYNDSLVTKVKASSGDQYNMCWLSTGGWERDLPKYHRTYSQSLLCRLYQGIRSRETCWSWCDKRSRARAGCQSK